MNRILILFIFILSFLIASFAWGQDAEQDSVQAEADEEAPQEVLELEEFIIELAPFKVFTIPRMEAVLPPVNFSNAFKADKFSPSPVVFHLRKDDLEPLKIDDFEKILAKVRK